MNICVGSNLLGIFDKDKKEVEKLDAYISDGEFDFKGKFIVH